MLPALFRVRNHFTVVVAAAAAAQAAAAVLSTQGDALSAESVGRARPSDCGLSLWCQLQSS